MQIFYTELPLAEGFAVGDHVHKHERLVKGREVSLASGYGLFSSLRNGPIMCWKCKCVADRWVVGKGPNDQKSKPVMNLFATRHHRPTKKRPLGWTELVMMTRDHIIPKSEGGMDSIANLRPGCDKCNGERGSKINKADRKFMDKHPELIDPIRRAKGQEAKARVLAHQRGEQHA
jgi:hypothetical protein